MNDEKAQRPSLNALRIAACVMLTVPPAAGVFFAGHPLERYLQFPPLTHYVEHAPFSWPAFAFFLLLDLVSLGFFIVWPIVRNWRNRPAWTPPTVEDSRKRLGKTITAAGVAICAIAWVLAWTRLPFMKDLQQFTFSPQWLGYILTVQGLTLMRTGRCMMLDRTAIFGKLFVLSAVFWWFFEYLNRFTQNWYYLGLENFTPLEYFLYVTPSFATVLPAVLGTSELLLSFDFMNWPFKNLPPFEPKRPKAVAGVVMLVSTVSLTLIGIFPDILFPLLWLSPLFIIVSMETILGRRTVFARGRFGDWRLLVSLATAALICGFFWEMWNVYSLAKWIYAIPFVNEPHIFEMPLLGFAGYLPFGLECHCVAQLFANYDIEDESGQSM